MRYRLRDLNLSILALVAIAVPAIAQEDRIIIKDGDKIAFLGDSITAGGAGYGRYCRLVVQGLKTVGIRATPVCAGIPGNKSSDMLMRLQSDVLDHKPDHVFLSAGVNDIWHGDHTVKIGVFQAKPGMGCGLEHYRIYVRQIVDRCQAAKADVILSTVLPIKEDPTFKLNKKSEQYNAFLKALAKEKKVPIADLNKAMFDRIAELKGRPESKGKRNLLTSDGVHPITAGHQVMAKGILKTMGLNDEELTRVEKEWNSSPKILIIGSRQVNSGGRTGGWIHLVLDGLNSKREMVTSVSHTGRSATLATLMSGLDEKLKDKHIRHVLLIPPRGDVDRATPLDQYKKSVTALIERAKKHGAKPVVATVVLLDGDPAGKFNVSAKAYSKVLREVCGEAKVPVADIGSIMQAHWKRNPKAKLTIGDERVSHEGAILLAKEVLRCVGFDDKAITALQPVWDDRGSYTFKYSYRTTFEIPLNEGGNKAVAEISSRYHKLDLDKVITLGLYELVAGDAAKNAERMKAFDAAWLDPKGEAKPRSIRYGAGPSVNYGRKLHAYMKREKTDLAGMYTRALKVGVCIMRKEDPLGRGTY